MQQFIHKKKLAVIVSMSLFVLLLGVAGILYYVNVAADGTVGAVELTSIDYTNMDLTVNTNGNTIVYYSTNKTKWHEVEGVAGKEGAGTLTYDISWISASKNTKLYFRGNMNNKTLLVTIPGYNSSFKAKFDKSSGEFEFLNTEGAEVIRWRKQTDYTWHYIWAEHGKTLVNSTDDPNYKKYGVIPIQPMEEFEKEVSDLRVKGAKLVFQIAPVAWSSTEDQGMRPSKDVTVSIPAKRTAPNMNVNIKKLTVNTRTNMEWTTTTKNPSETKEEDWKSCTESNMALSELASAALNGTNDVMLYFRTEATSSNCESKVAALLIPAREKAPNAPVVISQTAGTAAGRGKASLMFSNVPSTGYEYVISKNGDDIDETKVSWRKITKATTVKFTESSLPAGAKIYVRNAGVALNVNKGIDLKLPSQCFSATVPAYPAAASSTSKK